jgi:hypothetical protein
MKIIVGLCLLGALVAQTDWPALAIEGGIPTTARPEIGRIIRIFPNGQDSRCTATLVVPDFVLTAAHCIFYSAEHPEQYRFDVETPTGLRSYQVARIHNFGPQRFWGNSVPSPEQVNAVPRSPTPIRRGNNDVALVQLAESVPPDVARPAGVMVYYPEDATPATVFGYGENRCHGTRDRALVSSALERGLTGGPHPSWTIRSQIPAGPDSLRGRLGRPGDSRPRQRRRRYWGVASSTSGFFDTYGDVIWFRPEIERIVLGRQPAPLRKRRPVGGPDLGRAAPPIGLLFSGWRRARTTSDRCPGPEPGCHQRHRGS